MKILYIFLFNFSISIYAQPGKQIDIHYNSNKQENFETYIYEKITADAKAIVIDPFMTRNEKIINGRSDKSIKLDSMVTHVSNFITGVFDKGLVKSYEYNANDLLTAITHIYQHPDGEIAYGVRLLYSYNDFEALDTYEYQWWNTTDSIWLIDEIWKFEYDSQKRLNEVREENWDQDTMQNVYRTVYLYNNFDLLVLETHSKWDDVNSLWIDQHKTDLTYTPFKQLSTEIHSNKNSATMQWDFQTQVNYSYGQGLLLSTVVSTWAQSFWVLSYRYVYIYDASKNLIMLVTGERDEVFPVWINETQYQYYYDSLNRNTQSTRHEWIDQQWEKRDSSVNSFNIFNDIVSTIGYGWSYSSGGKWEAEDKTEYNFDTSIDFTDILWPDEPFEESIIYSKKLTSIISYTFLSQAETWHVEDSTHLFYSDTITKLREISNPIEHVTVYPNPAIDIITISNSTLVTPAKCEIYSFTGIKIKDAIVQDDRRVNVSDLGPGIYVYRIKSGINHYNGKLVMQ